MLTVSDFTLCFDGNYYVVSSADNDNVGINVTSVQTGKVEYFKICNMQDGTGNEHLRDTLHGVATSEYARKAIESFERMYCGGGHEE